MREDDAELKDFYRQCDIVFEVPDFSERWHLRFSVQEQGSPMTQDFPEFDEQVPLWDVALEALLRDEVMREARALTIDDIVRLGQQYNIRFDDLMVTLLELMLQGQWQYRNTQGESEQVTREQINALYVAGRIYPDDMVGFSGSWQPVSGVC